MRNEEWSSISEFRDSDKSPGYLLWNVQLIWKREIERELNLYKLTHPQFVILASIAYLTRNDNLVTQVELSRHTLCDINTTSQVLKLLEKNGLITRLNMLGNDRSKYPVLTTLGYDILKPAIAAVESIDSGFFNVLNSAELESFKLSILRLIQNSVNI